MKGRNVRERLNASQTMPSCLVIASELYENHTFFQLVYKVRSTYSPDWLFQFYDKMVRDARSESRPPLYCQRQLFEGSLVDK